MFPERRRRLNRKRSLYENFSEWEGRYDRNMSKPTAIVSFLKFVASVIAICVYGWLAMQLILTGPFGSCFVRNDNHIGPCSLNWLDPATAIILAFVITISIPV